MVKLLYNRYIHPQSILFAAVLLINTPSITGKEPFEAGKVLISNKNIMAALRAEDGELIHEVMSGIEFHELVSDAMTVQVKNDETGEIVSLLPGYLIDIPYFNASTFVYTEKPRVKASLSDDGKAIKELTILDA